jgi:hypothetical protein
MVAFLHRLIFSSAPTYDAAKTPFQWLLPFEDALKLKDAMPVIIQRDFMDKAVGRVLNRDTELGILSLQC